MSLSPPNSRGITTLGSVTTITGTATAADVLTATSATAAHWAAGGGSQTVLTATVAISAANILALDTVPKQLVAAQAGVAYAALTARMAFTHGTAYADGGEMRIGPDQQVTIEGVPDCFCNSGAVAAALQGAVDRWLVFTGYTNDAVPLSEAVGRPLVLDMMTAATGGTGTGVLTVFYVAVTV